MQGEALVAATLGLINNYGWAVSLQGLAWPSTPLLPKAQWVSDIHKHICVYVCMCIYTANPWTRGVWPAQVQAYGSVFSINTVWSSCPHMWYPHMWHSTKMGSKTVFLHSQLQIPNCELEILFSIPGWLNPCIRRTNCSYVKSYMWIFNIVGSAPLNPKTVQGFTVYLLCVYIDIHIHIKIHSPSCMWLNGTTKEKNNNLHFYKTFYLYQKLALLLYCFIPNFWGRLGRYYY